MDMVRSAQRIGSLRNSPNAARIPDLAAVLGRALTKIFSLVWALTMGVAGGLMMAGASDAAPWLRPLLLCAGFTGLVSGVFVFQVLVADRLFPGVDPRLVRNVEASFGVALMIGVVLTALALLS